MIDQSNERLLLVMNSGKKIYSASLLLSFLENLKHFKVADVLKNFVLDHII